MNLNEKIYLVPEGCWVSPSWIKKRFDELVKKQGNEAAVRSPRYQACREIWVAAAFHLGLRKRKDEEFWLAHGNDPPDVESYRFVKQKNQKSAERFPIEICEWEGHSTHSSLINALESKLKRKAYPSGTQLVCYAHSRTERVDLQFVFEHFQNNRPKIGCIWLLMSIDNSHGNHLLNRLFPEAFQILFDIHAEAESRKSQEPVIRFKRGFKTPSPEYGIIELPGF